MTTNISIHSGGLNFVDQSLELTIAELLNFAGEWYTFYGLSRPVFEYIDRRWSVEYALGFDGVDDYISIPNLEIDEQSLELETNIWISRENQGSSILNILNTDGDRILTLAATNEENFQVKAYYRNEGNIENKTLQNIALEEWQQLNIESDGEVLSINVDGEQEVFLTQIDLENSSFKVEFGARNQLDNFNGMIRNLEVHYEDTSLFSLESGENVVIKDETDSATIAGVHKLKKDRREKEFK